GDDSADHPGGDHHCATAATGTARLYSGGWPGLFRGSGGHGRHSHGEGRAVARRKTAHAPAYLHQPTGASGTTTPRGGGTGRPSRHQDDAPLCAPRTQSSAGRDPGVGGTAADATDGSGVIPRSPCHAGVTFVFGNRVSAGGPNGI